ncbi:MAG: aminodeoxychorismate/anthranilate synthase component II [bacterium]|jgi:para-aminobenzoate synthetase component 2|tara:strand:- start:510 stop:1094 length:585 start_codon:yes stop_codon:yes gene_type:complete
MVKNRKILMIDNYDSFTYNLVHYIEEFGAKVNVVRNDEISINKIKKYKPDIIFISPGPCSPKEAGISVKIVKELAGKIPIFGVCLGHQSIGYAFGSEIIKAKKLLHGKTSKIYHNKKGIYKNLPNPFEATRYHSLIINKRTLPEDFEITSQTEDGTIMGILNKKLNIEGVQFHPESILTKQGKKLIKNILETKY